MRLVPCKALLLIFMKYKSLVSSSLPILIGMIFVAEDSQANLPIKVYTFTKGKRLSSSVSLVHILSW